eukprot:jgi/Mesvir1/25862/Mv18507-RA.1
MKNDSVIRMITGEKVMMPPVFDADCGCEEHQFVPVLEGLEWIHYKNPQLFFAILEAGIKSGAFSFETPTSAGSAVFSGAPGPSQARRAPVNVSRVIPALPEMYFGVLTPSQLGSKYQNFHEDYTFFDLLGMTVALAKADKHLQFSAMCPKTPNAACRSVFRSSVFRQAARCLGSQLQGREVAGVPEIAGIYYQAETAILMATCIYPELASMAVIIAAEMKLADPLMVGKWAVEILCTEQGAVSATVAWGREQEVATNRARMVAIKQQLEEAQEQVSYLKVNLETASSVAADKEEAARLELEKMREELNVETARRGAERVRTQAVEADLVKARDALEAELEKARDALEDVQEELAVATTWHEEDEACLQASRADLAVVQAELAVAQAGLQKAQADLAEEAGRTRGAQAGMETTRADLDKARAELEKMRSDLAVATAKRAEEEAHSRAVRAEGVVLRTPAPTALRSMIASAVQSAAAVYTAPPAGDGIVEGVVPQYYHYPFGVEEYLHDRLGRKPTTLEFNLLEGRVMDRYVNRIDMAEGGDPVTINVHSKPMRYMFTQQHLGMLDRAFEAAKLRLAVGGDTRAPLVPESVPVRPVCGYGPRPAWTYPDTPAPTPALAVGPVTGAAATAGDDETVQGAPKRVKKENP